MPVRSHQIPEPGGATVLLFTCEGCGGPAMLSIGCNLRQALEQRDVALAGQWFCGTDAAGAPACAQGMEPVAGLSPAPESVAPPAADVTQLVTQPEQGRLL